jgi:undecaprenyl-diphosphatase
MSATASARGPEPRDDSPLDEPIDEAAPLADAASDSMGLRRARRRSVMLAVVLLAVAAALTVVAHSDPLHPWFQSFDDSVRRWAIDHRNGVATALAKTFSFVGSSYVSWPVRLAVCVLLVVRRRWAQLTAFSAAIVASEVAVGLLKDFVDRPRPTGGLVATTGMSFPSGHAIAGAVTAFGIVAALLPRGRRRWHWFVAATVFAAAMSWSRVYLSVHWATDTIAGSCIGVGLALVTEAIFEGGRSAVAATTQQIDEQPNRVGSG